MCVKNLEETALDEVLTVFTPLMKMEEEIELLNVRLQKGWAPQRS